MIKCAVLGSGSKGNSIYVDVDGIKILLDAGLNYKTTKARLDDINKIVSDITYLFITHEHGDHIASEKQMVKKHRCSVFSERVGDITHGEKIFLGAGAEIIPFRLDHDEPCHGFRVNDADGNSLVYVTDTGSIPCDSLEFMLDPNILIVETNHDMDMVYDGPYPDDLKERVLETHLENLQAHELIEAVAWEGLEYVVCHHLSEKNNSEKFARYEAESALKEFKTCEVIVAKQNEVSKLMTVF